MNAFITIVLTLRHVKNSDKICKRYDDIFLGRSSDNSQTRIFNDILNAWGF